MYDIPSNSRGTWTTIPLSLDSSTTSRLLVQKRQPTKAKDQGALKPLLRRILVMPASLNYAGCCAYMSVQDTFAISV
jgi:hypothetical protein